MASTDERPQIVFIDDDAKAGDLMLRFVDEKQYRYEIFKNPDHAMEFINANPVDLVVTDLRMPGMTGMEVLTEVKNKDADIPVIMMTAFSTVDNAIEALRLGAADFIKKPYDMDELLVLIEKTLNHHKLETENLLLKRQLSDEQHRYGMLGKSEPMQKVYSTIEKIADIRCNVILEGE